MSRAPIYPPTQPSIFGRVVSGAAVENACMALIAKWISTYLAETERQEGIDAGTTQRPRSLVIASSLDKMPEDQLPAIVLISIGLAERPLKDGSGSYRGRWDMGVAAIASARTQQESHQMAQRYIASLRNLVIQRPSLDGFASGADWQGEQYDQLDFDDMRSLDAGFGRFTIEVDNIANANAGPVTPDEPLDPDILPWPDWATVQTYDVHVDLVDVITKGGTTK